MGNKESRSARKEKKLAKKEKKKKSKECNRKADSHICLFLSAFESTGKSTIIEQIVSKYHQSQQLATAKYYFHTFVVNETAKSEDSANSYSYLEIANQNKTFLSHMFMWHPDLLKKNTNYELLLYGYIRSICFQEIPQPIFKIIDDFHSKPTITSQIIQHPSHHGLLRFELWEIHLPVLNYGEVFEISKFIIYVVDLSLYAQYVKLGDEVINAMKHDVNIFQTLMSSYWKRILRKRENIKKDKYTICGPKQTIVLLFNKCNLFQEQLKETQLAECDLFESENVIVGKEIEAVKQVYLDVVRKNCPPNVWPIAGHVSCYVMSANEQESVLKAFNELILDLQNSHDPYVI